jgi:hypothetical protein
LLLNIRKDGWNRESYVDRNPLFCEENIGDLELCVKWAAVTIYNGSKKQIP